MSPVKIEPRLPKGMRDFLPADMLKREYVFTLVRESFHLFGFEPLQTPVLELNETLMGKYGEDADKLIYHAKHTQGSEDLSLRYDLTVPLARVVAQHESELTFPFKRYQLSPVWRAERPQAGRFREFYQCDADIVGVGDAIADAEILALAHNFYQRVGFPQYTIKINNRKLLTAMGAYSGVTAEQLPDLYRSVDKFDKIGADGVSAELTKRGIAAEVVARMMQLLQINTGEGTARLDALQALMGDTATESIGELRQVAENLALFNVPTSAYEFDFTMVRGLGYYTGTIFETVIQQPNLGSVMGGGRYDDLIGLFRRESLPTVGLSFGIERIIGVMDELNLYPANVAKTVVQVLVTNFDASTRAHSAAFATELRRAGIACELFMQNKALGKQIGYADKKGIRCIAVIGGDEAAASTVKLKRLSDGTEATVPRAEAPAKLRDLLR
jgi:histidyl-tRNA synthetase